MQTLTHEPLPLSHTFGFNTTFCYCVAASWAVLWLSRSALNPPHPGSIRGRVVHVWYSVQEPGRRCTKLSFLLQNLALQLGLGQRCQPEGIAITWQQLFGLRKRRTVTLECGSLRKFWTTSSSSSCRVEWITDVWNNVTSLRWQQRSVPAACCCWCAPPRSVATKISYYITASAQRRVL